MIVLYAAEVVVDCVQYKLCKVKKVLVGLKGVPSIVTSDGRTIRYPDPLIKANDTVRINIANGKIEEFVKFDSGICRHCLPHHDGMVSLLLTEHCVG